MKIHVDSTAEQMGNRAAQETARRIRAAVQANGVCRILLSTGASQFEMLDALTKMEDIPWNQVVMFHLDEYVGMPMTHPASFRKYLKERFIDKVHPGAYFFVNGEGDIQKNIETLTQEIRKAPIDVALVGIGENGHIAFNDPAEADFNDPRWVKPVHLDEKCRQQQVNDGCFATIDDVPKTAMTVTIPGLLRAKAMFCVVPTRRKAEAVRRMLTEPVSEKCPASILRTKNAVKFYTDSDAASLL